MQEGILRFTEEMMQAVFKECRLTFSNTLFHHFLDTPYQKHMEKVGQSFLEPVY